MAEKPRTPSIAIALLPVVTLVLMLAVAIYIFRGDSLGGASQIVLLTATSICSLIAVFHCKVRWEEIEGQIARNIHGIAPSVIILLLIGTLSGSWMVSGVVPSLIYYGLQVMQTDLFLAACCLLCSIVSVMTGSSWTTIATIGIALIGIGEAQGFRTGWVAGAIISGAYFGDKMSPLSDTTVLAASVTDTPLFTHIRYMLYTTVPSLLVALVVFSVAGFAREAADASRITAFSEALRDSFHITPWLMIVPIVTGILIARKTPSIVVLFASSLLAGLFALLFQPGVLLEISGIADRGIIAYVKGLLMTFYDSTQIQTGDEALNALVSTRGMAGMLNTIWLIICAMCFGGAMTASGMLGSITRIFLRFMRGRTSMVASTVVSGLSLNICTADQFIAIILNSEMFKEVYKRRGFESRLLSRTTEDSVTVTSVLIPWTTCGMTQATILGVSTWTYLPYCVFNIVSPLMSVLVAATGYKIVRKGRGTGNSIADS
ncbi:Na+/H+ antiporter NhaC family protein [Parabacteroides sp. ZJ-118]|uniref:Na+/H+ antiporter NhaC family protein n=1 Tax=Parabacteroides sp. ZJ-118 TaxID=2709398 RepID=UPI0013EC2233|nr:Na+/H+ antiporter NhaC family protein [Parabacteroides sp. ZJ-118]